MISISLPWEGDTGKEWGLREDEEAPEGVLMSGFPRRTLYFLYFFL